ncbi:hypothetical protein EDB19DRAFT_1919704 [Suillus lakei]|nr:hypothetical protein EDB19DRAFT_1919704 [Suillus lakei]
MSLISCYKNLSVPKLRARRKKAANLNSAETHLTEPPVGLLDLITKPRSKRTGPTSCSTNVTGPHSLARRAPSKPLVLVDNTLLSPFYASLLLQGADIVIHSLTKYINGHSDIVMGAAILPSASTPDRDYDSLVQKLRFLQNGHGAIPSVFDCWLAQRGAKTLVVQMKAHGLNALRVASFLFSHPAVEHVIYPGLASHLLHALARASLSLAELPAQITHASIPPAEREVLGIEGLVCLSCRIEDVEDLVEDLRSALDGLEDSGFESGFATPSDVSDDGPDAVER